MYDPTPQVVTDWQVNAPDTFEKEPTGQFAHTRFAVVLGGID